MNITELTMESLLPYIPLLLFSLLPACDVIQPHLETSILEREERGREGRREGRREGGGWEGGDGGKGGRGGGREGGWEGREGRIG